MRPSARTLGVTGLLVVGVIAAVALRSRGGESRPERMSSANSTPTTGVTERAGSEGTDRRAEAPAKPGDAPAPPISLVGTILTDARAALSASQPARIDRVMVHDGEPVQRGQLLVLLDETQAHTQTQSAQAGLTAAQAQAAKAREAREAQLAKADADIETAQAGVQQASGKLRQAKLARDAVASAEKTDRVGAQENVCKAQTALNHARQQLHSLEELAQVGGVARNDLEGARAQVTTSESDLAAAQAQARSLEAGPGGAGPGKSISYRVALAQQDVNAVQEGVDQAKAGLETARRARRQIAAVAADDVRAAEAAVTQAEAGLSGVQALAGIARLTSPLDGIATGVTAHTGETAQPGIPLVTVVSLVGLRAEALAPARQLPRLRPGQTARILLDTRPDQPLTARLDTISQVAEPDGRSFRLRFRLLNPPPNLRLDQSVRILIPDK